MPVLKLHGSFGWKEKHNGLYLDYRYFLYHIPFQFKSDNMTFKDLEEPQFPARDNPVLLYPSFLKRIYTPELHEVWRLAGEAVRSCKKFVGAGYSLPEADVAVRTLLLPMRSRTQARAVDVEVYDPSDKTLVRWQEFLGINIQDYLSLGSISRTTEEACVTHLRSGPRY